MLKEIFYHIWSSIGRAMAPDTESKPILYIKIDALGDLFILLSVSKRIDASRMVIMLDEVHKTLVEHMKVNFKNVLYLNKKKFYRNPIYTYQKLSLISTYKVIILRPKLNKYLDSILLSTQKVEMSQSQKRYSSSQYLQMLEKLQIHNSLYKSNEKTIKNSTENYIVISPYTSDARREADIKKLSQVADKHFKDKRKIYCVQNIKQKKELLKKNITEIKVTESVIDFINLIKNSGGVVSNDSSAGHISLFYEKKTIVFLGGGQPKEFFPYGVDHIDNMLTLITNQPECSGCDWICSKPLTQGKFQCIQNL